MTVEKKIRSELIRMSLTMVVLLGLGIYAHDFVIAGVKAKVALNLTIFGTFGLAASIAFRSVMSLKNEVLAMNALQIDYGKRARNGDDVYAKPSIVFHEPELLGQGYRLITEELGNQDTLQIPSGTIQSIVHSIDTRINERKSTMLYFSGLMVFLGLLGAFMGLMKTVHSVGDLIGSMNGAMNAVQTPGAPDPFSKLIDGMQAPLAGMSVGFSSSLFGLTTSIALGALERFMTGAMKELRNEFESWLTNLALLEGSTPELAAPQNLDVNGQIIHMLELNARQFREMRDQLAHGNRVAGATQQALTDMAASVKSMTETVTKASDPRPMIEPLAGVIRELAEHQSGLVTHVHKLSEAGAASRDSVAAAMARLAAGTEILESTRSEMAARLEGLDVTSGEIVSRLRGFDSTRDEIVTRLDGLDSTREEITARLKGIDETARSLKKMKFAVAKGAAAPGEAGGARALFSRLAQTWTPQRDGTAPAPSESALIAAMTEQQRSYQERISADLDKLGALITAAKKDAA